MSGSDISVKTGPLTILIPSAQILGSLRVGQQCVITIDGVTTITFRLETIPEPEIRFPILFAEPFYERVASPLNFDGGEIGGDIEGVDNIGTLENPIEVN